MATVESLTQQTDEISRTLEYASCDLVAKLKDDEKTEVGHMLVGSIGVGVMHLAKPFGEGEMRLWYLGDLSDFSAGYMRAMWSETAPDTGIQIAYDYSWAVADPNDQYVEEAILNPEAVIDPIDLHPVKATEINSRRASFLRRRLNDFYFLGEPSYRRGQGVDRGEA